MIEPNPSPKGGGFPAAAGGDAMSSDAATGWQGADVNAPPAEDVGDPGPQFGEPCVNHDDCASGVCIDTDGNGTTECTAYALEQCPPGYEAQPLTVSGGDVIYVCMKAGMTGGTVGGGRGNTGENGECLPTCTGKQCGPDGCGGSCGWCSGDDSCQAGVCTAVPGCKPECADQMIGVDDGCGGVCSGSGMGIGLVPGGAQDAAYFVSQVMAGEVPLPEHLPIEGWLTEHDTALPPPQTDRLVTMHAFVGLFYDPVEGAPTVALQLGMNSGLSPEAIEEGRFNLSVVVDRSGSMDDAGKIEFAKEGLLLMLDTLDEQDLLSIVTYSNQAAVLLPPTPVTAANRPSIEQAISSIQTGGGTNLWAGLKLGYEQVLTSIAKSEYTPRVILLSDGLVTSGITDQASILAGSKAYNDEGIGITSIGVGKDIAFDLMHLLAAQGNGNFYFLDTAAKLQQVFQEELEYLLTPVADNLKVWFTLPDAFGVEDVYGFEYKHSDGEFHLLGPSPVYSVGASGEVLVDPPDPSESPNVTVSTLFASKKNGLLMVKLDSPDPEALLGFENSTLGKVFYSYELVDTAEVEAWDADLTIGSMEYDDADGFQYFSGAVMQRNFCILRAGLAMKQAVTLVHASGEAGISPAIQALAFAKTFCTGVGVQLADPKIDEDVALLEKLMENICAGICQDPAAP